MQVKYDQIFEQFSVPMLPRATRPATGCELRDGPIEFVNVRALDSHGAPLLDNASFSIPFGSHVALTSQHGEAPSVAGRILGG